jgi:Flp pilus assembly protein TadG
MSAASAVSPARQTGAIAIMCALSLVVIISFLALALDLSQLYNRKMELQNAADAVALAAAHELDGSDLGITRAMQLASNRFTAPAPGALTYGFGKRRLTWSPDAIAFGESPTGPWRGAVEAQASPARLIYVRINTSGLTGDHGEITTMFLQIFFPSVSSATRASAVAGRSALKVTPLGICAMRDAAHRDRNGELEEYGFRRGVGYNLLDLARTEATAGESYIVSPLPGVTPITSVATLAPFVCTGTMAMTRLTGGGKVAVAPTFPIGSLYHHLNSRFGLYNATTAPCDARTAPSDNNIMEYNTSVTGTPWMAARPQGQSARLLVSEGRRWNVASPDTPPADTTGVQFGPLWSYARAVPFSAYEAGKPEPATGYATFNTTAWETLYTPGRPATSATTAYPSAAATPTPYSYTNGTVFYKPPLSNSNKSVSNRRVLNVPLLACPVSDGKATVLGIGRFFMTVPATSGALYGEFAGLVPEQALGTQVVLYP